MKNSRKRGLKYHFPRGMFTFFRKTDPTSVHSEIVDFKDLVSQLVVPGIVNNGGYAPESW